MPSKAITIGSVKGGCGKTTVALNLARRLSDKFKYRVGYVDADLDNSSVGQFTGINAEMAVKDGKMWIPHNWRGIKVWSMSFIAGVKESVSLTDSNYADLLFDALHSTEWGNIDFFIIDLRAGSSDVFKSAVTIFGEAFAGTIIVHQPSMISAFYRTLNFHKHFHIPVLGVVENMGTFTCSKCETVHDMFNGNQTNEIAKEYGVKIIGGLPFDTDIPRKMIKDGGLLYTQSLKVFDDVASIVINAPVVETSFFKDLVSKLDTKVQSLFARVVAKIINLSNKDLDMSSIRNRSNLTEKKVFRLCITEKGTNKELTGITLRLDETGLVGLPVGTPWEFGVVCDYITFSRIILRTKKVGKDKYEYFDAQKAWLNGEIQGVGPGYSPKIARVMRTIFQDDKLMTEVSKRYGRLLRRFV